MAVSEGRTGARFLPAREGLRGIIHVPGDKSVSHRALLLGAVNDGSLSVTGFLRSADTLATLAAIRALGVEVMEAGQPLLEGVQPGETGNQIRVIKDDATEHHDAGTPEVRL